MNEDAILLLIERVTWAQIYWFLLSMTPSMLSNTEAFIQDWSHNSESSAARMKAKQPGESRAEKSWSNNLLKESEDSLLILY